MDELKSFCLITILAVLLVVRGRHWLLSFPRRLANYQSLVSVEMVSQQWSGGRRPHGMVRLSCVFSAAETLAWHTDQIIQDGWTGDRLGQHQHHSSATRYPFWSDEHALHATLLTLKAQCLSSQLLLTGMFHLKACRLEKRKLSIFPNITMKVYCSRMNILIKHDLQ